MTADAGGVATTKARVRSGTVIVVALALVALLMAVGYTFSNDPRCALNVADRPEFETAKVEGNVEWRWWPPGFVTVCQAFDAHGNEIPYVPAED